MRVPLLASLLASTAIALPRQSGNTTTWIPGSTAGTDALAKEGLLKLTEYLQTNASALESNSSCTLSNAYKRKEWDTHTPTEKKEYIDAVLCLQSLPAQSGELVPGARTRYDVCYLLNVFYIACPLWLQMLCLTTEADMCVT